MVSFKGKHQLKQYVANKKAHQWGMKLWVLSDSNTGYTHQINVYKGRQMKFVVLMDKYKIKYLLLRCLSNFKLNKLNVLVFGNSVS